MADKISENRSGFTEIKESASLSPAQLESQLDMPVDEIPIDDKWSWNPVDWYTGIKHEITDFNIQMTEKKRVMIRAVFGEGLVTFLFMFIVMAIGVNNGRQENPENLVLGCIGTALASVALIYSFADVSGAHFNPAVTFATIITGKMSVRKGILFIGIQLFSATFATLALMVVYPNVTGSTSKVSIAQFVSVSAASDAHLLQAFFMEVILTFILVYVIFATAFDTVDTKGVKVKAQGEEHSGQNLTIYTTSGNTKAGFAPLSIGFTLGFLGLIGGTVSGGAFNPARVFGPALISGNWRNHWLYWIADFVGAGLAGSIQSFFAHEAQQASASIKTSKGSK